MRRAHAEFEMFALIGKPRAGTDRLFDQVVEMLALGIMSGRYAAGDILPNEAALAKDVSVSRSAYREAVKFLTSKGLIEARPKTGTRVRPRLDWNLLDPDILRWSLQAGPSVEFARDLFELRRIVEPEATRLAALRRTDADLAHIEDALVRMETNPPQSAPSIRADLDFHEHVFEATGNRALACLKNVVAPTILWSQEVKQAIGPDEFILSLKDHRRIFEALRAGDGEQAAAQATLLITDALNSTTLAIEKIRDSGGTILPLWRLRAKG